MPTIFHAETLQAAIVNASAQAKQHGCTVYVNAIVSLQTDMTPIVSFMSSDWYATGQTVMRCDLRKGRNGQPDHVETERT